MVRFNPSRELAGYLRKTLALTEEQEEIAAYSLLILFQTVISLLGVSLVAWLAGCLTAALAALFTSAFLRSFSGGAHCTSPARCTVLSILTVPLLGTLATNLAPFFSRPLLALVVLAGGVLAFAVVLRLAPVDSPAKPITSSRERQRFRWLSSAAVLGVVTLQLALLVLSSPNMAILILAAEMGMLWQVFSLTRTGHRFVARIDKLLEFI
ncbi:Accessory gene regulator B [Desulfofundulus kuznetsovii DSM 6115]|uniref:Accessory gene regulator B n=1 Tax=Desulfofundulus kuznetsovii (strain DSM 6115 / VKM B-1805 / 17) TaxID=760568 RepID=A0AAU8PVG6_DESK7|nr:Accessory gene regulator B [Desulfofundulus kuznetsovii DSM 6115]